MTFRGAAEISIPRLHYPDLAHLAADEVTLEGDEAHHAVRVRRLRADAEVEIFDGMGMHAPARILSVQAGRRASLRLKLRAAPSQSPQLQPILQIAAPPPKPDRQTLLVDQLSQVGATEWIPISTAYTQHSPGSMKREKLERVAIEAAKQCGRFHLLTIAEPRTLEEVLKAPGVVICDAQGRSLVRASEQFGDRITVVVGPEGGLSPEELALAESQQVPSMQLGPHILRLETAAVTAAAMIRGIVLDAPRLTTAKEDSDAS